MPQFTVYFTQTMSTAITVEAENFDAAIEAAEESDQMPGTGICAQCSGWGSDWSIDTAGQWELESVEDASGAVVWRDQQH